MKKFALALLLAASAFTFNAQAQEVRVVAGPVLRCRYDRACHYDRWRHRWVCRPVYRPYRYW